MRMLLEAVKRPPHVLLGQAGVGQGLDDALPLDLQLALVRRVAGNVLVNTHDGRAMLKVNHKAESLPGELRTKKQELGILSSYFVTVKRWGHYAIDRGVGVAGETVLALN